MNPMTSTSTTGRQHVRTHADSNFDWGAAFVPIPVSQRVGDDYLR